MKTLIKNIQKIVGVSEESKCTMKKGDDMNKISIINDGWILIENDLIADFGNMETWQGVDDWNNTNIFDANNGTVLPTWCDSHTHIVYAGTRELEFLDRINGLSYEEIAKNGGGILNSAKLLSKTHENALYKQASKRLDKLIRLGTGSIEIKSGYGLSTENEIKMLKVIHRLKQDYPIPIKATFIGAHADPKDLTQDKYVSIIINEMIPEVAKQNLADYIDVFCDRGFFTPLETEKILECGIKHGLTPKIHANELDCSGGIQVGVKMNALSVDHLEFTGKKEINLLKHSNTIPTLLPGTAHFLNLDYPPARLMIESGLGIAIASDYNPGSCPSGDIAKTMSLACIKMKLTPTEAINAVTINGAFAMETDHLLGNIKKGKKANLIITESIPSINYIAYSMGENNIAKIIINGKIYHDSETNY